MIKTLLPIGLMAALFCGVAAAEDKKPKIVTGYTDTPVIPGQKWKVHDDERPRPPVVEPSESFSEGATPPADATVLFDGSSLDAWVNQKTGEAPGWKIVDDYVEVVPKSGTIQTKENFSDFQLHLEFATPEEVSGHSQGRGNSGVIVFGQYEIQVLDSYNNKSYADGQAGAMYGQFPPLRNASRPPGEWQTYDIIFEAPRWEGEELIKKASVTVIHNGVLLHNRKEYIGAVKHKGIGTYGEPESEGPIVLQDHSNPTRFRNIWIRPIGVYDEGEE